MKSIHPSFLSYTQESLPPAQLWIGNHATGIESAELFLQKMFCKNNGCRTCITCMQIREKQHHSILWLHPEKNYTVDQLEELFHILSFQLQPEQLFFFVIQKADFLSPACANKLLKSMEEPPRGYHFILLAERSDQILPTILSRSVIYTLHNTEASIPFAQLYECFTTKMVEVNQFSKIIDVTTISERESVELLNQILEYWMKQYNIYHSATHNDKPTLQIIITILKQALYMPPMPGSVIIFWRNLYLQLHRSMNLIDKKLD